MRTETHAVLYNPDTDQCVRKLVEGSPSPRRRTHLYPRWSKKRRGNLDAMTFDGMWIATNQNRVRLEDPRWKHSDWCYALFTYDDYGNVVKVEPDMNHY